MENDPLSNPVLDPEATAEVKSKLESSTEHAKTSVTDLKSAAIGLKDAAAARAGEFKDAATAKAGELKEAAAAKASEFRNTASAKASEFKEKAQQHYKTAKAKTQTLQDDGEEYVRANPTKSILTALACGFVLGLALRK